MSGPRNTGRVVSEAQFRRWWLDTSITVAQIGERLGIGQQAVTHRAQIRKLPPRPKSGAKPACDEAKFRRLYAAGISHVEMAEFFDCDIKTVLNTRKRLGISNRPRGKRCKVKLADILRECLAAAAREEQAALRLAEMVDAPSKVWRAA